MANQIQGKIAQIIGPVIDVVFQEVEELPNIYDALEVVREGQKGLILEVEQHIGEDFVKHILLDKLHMKHIVIGYDHHFGKNKSGNFELLEKMASENNFVVEETKAVLVNGLAVSSTKIRNALSEGDIITANEFLGYHYPVSGTVVAGKKIGRTIGYPTANIDVDPIKLLPKNGAYIVDVEHNGQMHKGMLSIGTNPTVNGTKKTTEVYILDFDQDIYGENITVYFRDYLHDEIKFESLEKLIERLDEDKQLTMDFFK